MPEKHPNTERWGGPGASHEDRSEPRPDPKVKDPDDPDRFNRHSRVSGGGGEGDVHHAHAPKAKRDFEANRAQKSLD
jgi:hypothetical protein